MPVLGPVDDDSSQSGGSYRTSVLLVNPLREHAAENECKRKRHRCAPERTGRSGNHGINRAILHVAQPPKDSGRQNDADADDGGRKGGRHRCRSGVQCSLKNESSVPPTHSAVKRSCRSQYTAACRGALAPVGFANASHHVERPGVSVTACPAWLHVTPPASPIARTSGTSWRTRCVTTDAHDGNESAGPGGGIVYESVATTAAAL